MVNIGFSPSCITTLTLRIVNPQQLQATLYALHLPPVLLLPICTDYTQTLIAHTSQVLWLLRLMLSRFSSHCI